MFILLPMALLVIGVIVVIALLVGSRRASVERGISVDVQRVAEVAAQVAHTRRAMAIALSAYLVVGFVATFDPLGAQPANWLGLGRAFGIAIAAIVAVAVVAFAPFASWSMEAGPRTADLTPRTGGSFGPRWGFTLPIVSAGMLIAFLTVTGLLSTPDENGLYRQFTIATETGSRSGTPYPGWFYGIPVIAVTVLLALSVLLALHRVASAPRPTVDALFSVDDELRRSLTRFVMLLSTSALLLYFGAFALVAGAVTVNSANYSSPSPDWRISDEGVVLGGEMLSEQLQPAFTVGVAEIVAGFVLVALSLILLGASMVTARLGWTTSTADAEAVAA